MAKELQKVCIHGIMYFIDFKLGQVRECNNPHHFIDFSELDERAKSQIRTTRATFESLTYSFKLDE